MGTARLGNRWKWLLTVELGLRTLWMYIVFGASLALLQLRHWLRFVGVWLLRFERRHRRHVSTDVILTLLDYAYDVVEGPNEAAAAAAAGPREALAGAVGKALAGAWAALAMAWLAAVWLGGAAGALRTWACGGGSGSGAAGGASQPLAHAAALRELLADFQRLHLVTHAQSVQGVLLSVFTKQTSLLRGQPVSHRVAFQFADSDAEVSTRLEQGEPIDVTYGEASCLIRLLSEVIAWELFLAHVAPPAAAASGVVTHQVGLMLRNTPEYNLLWLAVARASGPLTLLAALHARGGRRGPPPPPAEAAVYHNCSTALINTNVASNDLLFHALSCTNPSILILEEAFVHLLVAPDGAGAGTQGRATMRLNVPPSVRKIFVWRGKHTALVPLSATGAPAAHGSMPSPLLSILTLLAQHNQRPAGAGEAVDAGLPTQHTVLELFDGPLKEIYEEWRRADEEGAAPSSTSSSSSFAGHPRELSLSSRRDSIASSTSAGGPPHERAAPRPPRPESRSTAPPPPPSHADGSLFPFLLPLLLRHARFFLPTAANGEPQCTRADVDAVYDATSVALRRFTQSQPLLHIFTSGTTGLPKAAKFSHIRFFATMFLSSVMEMRNKTDSVVREKVERRWQRECHRHQKHDPPQPVSRSEEAALKAEWIAIEIEKELAMLTVYNCLPMYHSVGSVFCLGHLIYCLLEQQRAEHRRGGGVGPIRGLQQVLGAPLHGVMAAAGAMVAFGLSPLALVASALIVLVTGGGRSTGPLAGADGRPAAVAHASCALCSRSTSRKHVPTPTARMVLRTKFSATSLRSDLVVYRVTVVQYIGEVLRYALTHEQRRLAAAAGPGQSAGSPALDGEDVWVVPFAFGNGLRGDIWLEAKRLLRIAQVVEFYSSTEGNIFLLNLYDIPGCIGHLPIFPPGLYFLSPLFYPIFPFRVVRMQNDVDVASGGPSASPDANACMNTFYRSPWHGCCVNSEPNEPGQILGMIAQGFDIFGLRCFDGYHNKRDTQKKIVRDVIWWGDAFFLSGDLVRFDEFGFVFFVDRIGDTFRWKGENVATMEVANIINRATGRSGVMVQEAVVYGVTVEGREGRAGMAKLVLARSGTGAAAAAGKAGGHQHGWGGKPGTSLSLAEEQLFMQDELYGLLASKNTAHSLPSYAIPLFIRVDEPVVDGERSEEDGAAVVETVSPKKLRDSIITSTFKHKKTQLQAEGYAYILATGNNSEPPLAGASTAASAVASRVYVLVSAKAVFEKAVKASVPHAGPGIGYVPLTPDTVALFGEHFSACGW